ncbi:MAG: hypothetical protein PHU14_12530 [Methylovulum sp.]|nr:hypothetical protein [Methylovulum sp.]
MTLLVAWTAVDTHGPASLYLASDSRISWGTAATFNYGRKVFAFRNWPDVIGYCGDVLFPSIALNQIVELADAGLLFSPTSSCKQKFQSIVDKLNDLFREYPKLHSGLADNSLGIIHASRDPVDNSKFFCHTISWSKTRGWRGEECLLPSRSKVLFALGTGAKEFNENYARYEQGVNSGTSRAVFHCFCDSLANITDPFVGGAPQLVGIIRKPQSTAITYGVIYEGRKMFLGVHIDNLRNFDTVQWRNANFELCDPQTMERRSNAQPQPDPLRRP